jgi:hypothetical protein
MSTPRKPHCHSLLFVALIAAISLGCVGVAPSQSQRATFEWVDIGADPESPSRRLVLKNDFD